ncbi:MAG: PD-(D/E)XK nuclease family protein, partial [Bryobacteraceae bacterium]
IGGKDRWERRLGGLVELLRAKYASSGDESEQALHRRNLDRLESLSKFALPVIEQLARLPARATWGEWIESLYDLASGTLRDPAGVQQLLDELRLMEDIGPVELFDVTRVLEESLRFLRLEPERDRYGRVFVAGIEEARGMCFRVVALPGLNEGSFPRRVVEDPLLLDEYKDAISPSLYKTTEADEQRMLRTAAACASERLIASYSRMDLLTGRPRVLSLYAFELMQSARGAGLDVRDIEAEARRGAETRVGWPAPITPESAIDDAEFDLAILHPAFQGIGGKGAGAYLTKVNEHLVSSLRTRGRRWRPKWYGADGIADPDIEMLQILEGFRPGIHAYSASALQQYAVCPYKFVLSAIHRLRPADVPAPLERMDPQIRGSLYHSVQFNLLRELRARDLLPLDETRREEAFEALDRWVRDVAAEFAEKLAPAIPHIWRSELAAIRADLRGWVHRMISPDPGWTPLAFELSFGVQPDDRHDPRSVREPVTVLDRFLLMGSIDLVERHASGMLRVIDHKTGKPPSPLPQSVGRGEVLQPVLYAMAAEQMLKEKAVAGRLHYATLRSNYRTVDVLLGETSRRRVEQVLTTIDNALYNGFLPAAPRAKACENCDYRPVCGPYEEERVTIKPKPELKPLRDLRSLP